MKMSIIKKDNRINNFYKNCMNNNKKIINMNRVN